MSAAQSRAREPFLIRRLRSRERELGLAIRAHLEERRKPPRALVDEHREVWDALRRERGVA